MSWTDAFIVLRNEYEYLTRVAANQPQLDVQVAVTTVVAAVVVSWILIRLAATMFQRRR